MLHYMRSLMVARIKSERGATAVEYGLMVVLIAAVIVGTVYIIGQQIGTGFNTVESELNTATT